ncbi:class I SAM-dependent methyltransferase [Bacteroidota bacterium]
MENFWDQRYSEPGFAYGREPNDFFRHIIDELSPGKLLLPGEGEGRNAIYAASRGWEVTAFDQSRIAREKALNWAGEMGLQLEYLLADISAFTCAFPEYDLIAMVYIHLPPSIRHMVHQKLTACIKPGGIIIMECFHKSQLNYGTGGPPVEELLYLEEDLMTDFSQLEITKCEQQILDIHEGEYHSGKSSIIRLIAQKPL